MNPAYLGDSYDVVKRFFCGALRSTGYAVYIDPKFTGHWTISQRGSFSRFVGARPLGTRVSNPNAALLIDPDKGIRDRPGPQHTTFADIASRCEQFALILVFDQSFARGPNVRAEVSRKLFALRELGVRGVYYDSHARFLICGKMSSRVMRFQKALVQTGLPRERFVGIPASATRPAH